MPKAQTSKEFNAICVPAQYKHVNLSCHYDNDYPRIRESERSQFGRLAAEEIEADDPDRPYDERSHQLLEKQRSFIGAIRNHPRYGAYVQSLVWTYRDWGGVRSLPSTIGLVTCGRSFFLL